MQTFITLFALVLLAIGGPDEVATCSITNVQSDQVHCCKLPSGQTCCAETLDEDGKVAGCGCSP